MRLAFAGTPEFARVALDALVAAGHDLTLVLTQPDRPAGRGLKLQASPVKVAALSLGVPVLQVRSLRLDGRYPDEAQLAHDALRQAAPEVLIVAAYGLILPSWVLQLPKHGCLNIHASVLPRWRGAAPIHRAIEAGDAQTGITIMQMDEGLDTGAMLLAQSLPINPTTTTASLHDALATLGGELIVQALNLVERGQAKPQVQPSEGVSYAAKIDKQEAAIDWRQDAASIERKVRAFDPAPGAHACVGTDTIKVWGAQALAHAGTPAPGTVMQAHGDDLIIACQAGTALRLTHVQRPGGKRQTAQEFLQARPQTVGAVWASSELQPPPRP